MSISLKKWRSALEEDWLHRPMLELGRENPTIDLRSFLQHPGEELRGFNGMTPSEIVDAVANRKFPNLLGGFDPEQPRIYKGVWL